MTKIMSLPDPRYQTKYSDSYVGPLFFLQKKMIIPSSTQEVWCEPGYQPKRDPKGFDVTINDYTFTDMYYGGPNWDKVVHTPYKSYN